MKKVAGLILASTLVYANNVDTAKQLFKDGQYEKSYNQFYDLFLKDMGNSEINFYLGMNAYKKGDYNSAISAYERVLFTDSNNNYAKLELVRCYFAKESYGHANLSLSKINLSDNKDENFKEQYKMLAAQVKSKLDPTVLSGAIMVGMGYDSNVYSKADADTFDITLGNFNIQVQNTTLDQHSTFVNEMVYLNYKDISRATSITGIEGVAFAKQFSQAQDRNIVFSSISPYAQFFLSPKTDVKYTVGLEFINLDGDSYSKTGLFKAQITNKFDDIYTYSAYFQKKFVNNTSVDTSNRDSEIGTIFGSINKKVGDKSNFITSFSVDDENVDDKNVLGIANRTITLGLSYDYRYAKGESLKFKYTNSNKTYKDVDPFFGVIKNNKEHTFSATQYIPINKGWLGEYKFKSTNVSSNVEANKYDKFAFSINMIHTF